MTTQRRPHWDDDLIDAVFRALSHTYRAQGWAGGIAIDLDESVYPLIAAVEDWMDANDNPLPHVLNECLQWLDAERAAIQRVRDACVSSHVDDKGKKVVFLDRIQRALDGDA